MTDINREFEDHTYRLLRGLQQPKDAYQKHSAYIVPPARHYARIPWWTFRTPVYDDVYVFFGKRMEDKATGFSPDPLETDDTEKCWSQDEEYDDPSNKRRNILDEDITLTFDVELDSDDDEDDFKAKVSNKVPTFTVDFRVIKKQNQPSGMILKKENADDCSEVQNNDEEKMSDENGDHSMVYNTEDKMNEEKDEHDVVYTDKDIISETDGHGVVNTDKDETSEKDGKEDEDNMADENGEHDLEYNGKDVMEMFEKKRDYDLVNKDEDSLFEKNNDHGVLYKNEDEKFDRNDAHGVVYTNDGRMSDNKDEYNLVNNTNMIDEIFERNDAPGVKNTEEEKHLTFNGQYNDTDLPTCNSNTKVVQNETDKNIIDHDDNDLEGLLGIYARGQYDFICLNDKVNIDTHIEDYNDEMQGVLGLYSSD